jgi:hypothetical protein
MRTLIVALATVLALGTAAHAGSVRKPLHRPILRVPVVISDPYWVPDARPAPVMRDLHW